MKSDTNCPLPPICTDWPSCPPCTNECAQPARPPGFGLVRAGIYTPPPWTFYAGGGGGTRRHPRAPRRRGLPCIATRVSARWPAGGDAWSCCRLRFAICGASASMDKLLQGTNCWQGTWQRRHSKDNLENNHMHECVWVAMSASEAQCSAKVRAVMSVEWASKRLQLQPFREAKWARLMPHTWAHQI